MMSLYKIQDTLCLAAAYILLLGWLYQPLIGWLWILSLCSVIMLVLQSLALTPPLAKRTLSLFSVLTAIALAYSVYNAGLLHAMINLLLLGTSLKLLTLHGDRDRFQLIVTLIFALGCGYLYHQSLFAWLFSMTILLLLLLSLSSYITPQISVLGLLQRQAPALIGSLAIAVVLWLVLPHIGPLWRMPSVDSGRSGLSDTLRPGDIARLADSTQLAFNSRFSGPVPVAGQRYWRAMVLEHFDGRSWTQDKPSTFHRSGQSPTGNYYQYQIELAGPSEKWLFALDLAYSNTAGIRQTQGYQLQVSHPRYPIRRYTVRSYYQQPLEAGTTSHVLKRNVQLPAEDPNPRTYQWATSLHQRYPDSAQFIAAVLNFFATQHFVYSLHPGAMPDNMLDTFLFERRQGFCGHYASAMAYILRVAGIPARVVTGYLGGEQLDDHDLAIYQYDAHAWVEAWQPHRGWVRYDPTAVVAPGRLTQGMRQALLDSQQQQSGSAMSLFSLRSAIWLQHMQLWMARVDLQWQKWVVNFNTQRQLNLFEYIFGKITAIRIMLIGLFALVVICVILAALFWRQWWPVNRPRHQQLYQQALKLLARKGILRPKSMAVNDFSRWITAHYAAPVSQPFQRISDYFMACEYADATAPPCKEALTQLRRALKSVKASQERG